MQINLQRVLKVYAIGNTQCLESYASVLSMDAYKAVFEKRGVYGFKPPEV